MADNDFPPILTTEQAEKFTGLSRRTLEKRRITTSNDPPFLKIGRAVRYERDVLARWLESKRRASTSDPGPVKSPR